MSYPLSGMILIGMINFSYAMEDPTQPNPVNESITFSLRSTADTDSESDPEPEDETISQNYYETLEKIVQKDVDQMEKKAQEEKMVKEVKTATNLLIDRSTNIKSEKNDQNTEHTVSPAPEETVSVEKQTSFKKVIQRLCNNTSTMALPQQKNKGNEKRRWSESNLEDYITETLYNHRKSTKRR